MNLKIKIILLLSLLISVSCQSKSKWTREQFRAHQESSPIHKTEYWSRWINLPLEERIVAATPEMIQFLSDDNEFNHFPNTPKTVVLTEEYKRIIKEAVGKLPHWIKKSIENKITGIMILDDLGGSALTNEIMGFKDKGFIVFDIKTLTKKANEWCTWKESSAFKTGEYSLRCKLEEDDKNDVVGAFRYIFLHEVAHILNLGSKLLLFWKSDESLSGKDTKRFPFLKESWDIKENGVFVKKHQYKNINNVSFYIPEYAKENSLMIETYKELASSNFPTLYGATNLGDDFAESYVNYIHTQIFKKPFEIDIYKGSKKVFTYKACWKDNRCKAKAKLMKQLLNH